MALLALGPSVSPSLAGQELARIPIVEAPPGTTGLGAGVRLGTSPYVAGSTSFDLVPLYLYEGRYLFAHGTSAGVHAVRTRRFGLDLFARFRFLSLDPEAEPLLEGLEERKTTIDGGVAVYGRVGRQGTLRLEWLHDLLDRSEGQEVNLSYRWQFYSGRWGLSPFLNVAWQNEDFTNYYFGVRASEARPWRPEYRLGAGVSFQYGINTSYMLTQRMLLFVNFGISELDDEIRASPIVEDNRLATAYVGLTYNFGNVKQAATPDPDRLHEWSWRVNYGYQAEGNIVGEINVGNIKKNATATTQIGGLVVSKLLADGPRSDFLGRLGVYRHFEGGAQDDFWNFVAYIMAMGKGHLPWSDKTAFRWGFGFGFSYAQAVPIVEQIKQGDRPTQQFLNYLEMTLDFPMARAFKARAVRNCYMGVTAVHRSGIFAASELLGGVTGGSDWITLHVECVR